MSGGALTKTPPFHGAMPAGQSKPSAKKPEDQDLNWPFHRRRSQRREWLICEFFNCCSAMIRA